jgi:pilus assembly protein Flp/PilA
MDLMRQLHVRLSLLKLESEEGQTLVEYGLILALIAVVCITVLTTLGTNIQGKLNTVATAL